MTAIIYKTIIIYFAVIIAMRLMGKRQVGEMSAPEIIIALLISDIAAMPLTQTDIPLIHGIVSIAILVMLEIIISFIDLKFPFFTKITQGVPIIIVQDGVISENAMKRTRLTISEFNEELRLKNAKLQDIHTAIIERTGQISIVPKSSALGVTRSDLDIKNQDEPLEFAVIIDGKINHANLNLIKKDSKFINDTLSQKKIKDIKDVFIMCADKNGLTFFQKKNKQ